MPFRESSLNDLSERVEMFGIRESRNTTRGWFDKMNR